MKKLLLSILLVFCLNSYAEFTQRLNAKYERKYNGWSDYYNVDVTIITGWELNQATESYNYGIYNTYAVIFWGQGKATVIKLSGYLSCGNYATPNCIAYNYNLEGIDQNGTKWYICLNSSAYCY
jgi:hypothetical protein